MLSGTDPTYMAQLLFGTCHKLLISPVNRVVPHNSTYHLQRTAVVVINYLETSNTPAQSPIVA